MVDRPSEDEIRRQLADALARWACDRDRLHNLRSELRRLLRESEGDDSPLARALRAALAASL